MRSKRKQRQRPGDRQQILGPKLGVDMNKHAVGGLALAGMTRDCTAMNEVRESSNGREHETSNERPYENVGAKLNCR